MRPIALALPMFIGLILCFESAASMRTSQAMSWQCGGGHTMGVVFDTTTGHSGVGELDSKQVTVFCDSAKLKGFTNHSKNEQEYASNDKITEACEKGPDPDWLAGCYENFVKQCVYKYPSGQPAIFANCITGKKRGSSGGNNDGGNGAIGR